MGMHSYEKEVSMVLKRFLSAFVLSALLISVTGFLETAAHSTLWAADPLVRNTLYGAVKGIEDSHDTWSWRGVPFAKPPVGSLRWRAPQDPDPWCGVRDCASFGNFSAQYGNFISETGYESMGGFMRKGVLAGSEDCLYLNIWRPGSSRNNLPVYVFIHGGANVFGRSDLSIYHGAHFASRSDMVFVSINYRLGHLGWFAHPALRTGNPLDDSGNYGTLDIIKALDWIQDNIEAFGGNPDNVTVCGQSAGAFNIYSLLVSPLAEELFHRAVLMSGAPVACTMANAEKASLKAVYRLLRQDGYADTDATAESFIASRGSVWLKNYLLSKTIDELYPPENAGPVGTLLDKMEVPSAMGAGITDGFVIPASPSSSMKNGTHHQVPIMMGNTTEEIKLFLPFFFTDPAKLWTALYRFDPDNPQFKLSDFLSPSYWATLPLYNTITYFGQLVFQTYGVDTTARTLSKHQQDVYVYKFAWDEEPKPFDFLMGAAHAIDIAFVFGNFPSDPETCTHMAWSRRNKPGRVALSDAMMSYHAQFARYGNPNAAGLPAWAPWNNAKGSPKRIVFDTGGIHMSTKCAEPVEMPCPQCTLTDVLHLLIGYR